MINFIVSFFVVGVIFQPPQTECKTFVHSSITFAMSSADKVISMSVIDINSLQNFAVSKKINSKLSSINMEQLCITKYKVMSYRVSVYDIF